MACNMSSRNFPPFLLPCLTLLILLTVPVAAFGAGNIAGVAAIEGSNFRHGDIEDALLNILMARAAGGKKFSKMDVKRTYFGNWLRDYSQAVDVGTVKYVSAEAIRLILWVLGFMSFGYGTGGFEVTTERLGCYRPEEHIDNPKNYADNEDARRYDRRLRGPVDERTELAIDPRTGLKNYIATEDIGIATSAALVRDVFGRSIQLGRQYGRSRRKEDLWEALRLLGTGCHCLEDYLAHSNYVELALIELGENSIFPHVGRHTQLRLPGARNPVYPIITGTFGGTDFLHSVMGEFSDKASQSEIQELEGTIQSSGQADMSLLQSLLSQVPEGLFGGKNQAGKVDQLQMNAQAAQMQNTSISPKQPEEWTKQLQAISKQIYPILEWHDDVMLSITEFIEKVPILPQLIEELQDQVNIFVFSLLAPFIAPVIKQVKTELATGSSEIIQSSREQQFIVFNDDRCSDPTHSMLSKDHFSNVLNDPAGKAASQVLNWVIPQLMACWDDERMDVNRTLNRIIYGTFHHPALKDHGDDGAADGRRGMFSVIQQWWAQKDRQEKADLRDQLSREGVKEGRNHKEGVHDTGHGCCKPLGMPSTKTASLPVGNILGEINSALGGNSAFGAGATKPSASAQTGTSFGKSMGEAVGGGVFGGLIGGLVGGIGGDLLGNAFGGPEAHKQAFESSQYGQDGSYTQTITETGFVQPKSGRQQPRYSQAEFSETNFPDGRRREEIDRYEQTGGYGQGGFQHTTETHYESSGGQWQTEVRTEGRNASGQYYEEENYHKGRGEQGGRSNSDSDDHKKRGKHHKHDSSRGEGTANPYHERQRGERGDYQNESQSQSHRGYGQQTRFGEQQSGTMPGAFGAEDYEQRRGTGFEEGYGREEAYGSGTGYGQRQNRQETYAQEQDSFTTGGGYGATQSFGGGSRFPGNEGFGGDEESRGSRGYQQEGYNEEGEYGQERRERREREYDEE